MITTNTYQMVRNPLEARIMKISDGSHSHQKAPYYTKGLNEKYLVRSVGHMAWEYLRDRGYKDIPECFCEECVSRKSDSQGN